MLVVSAAGTAVASNALLIGEVSRRTAADERGLVPSTRLRIRDDRFRSATA